MSAEAGVLVISTPGADILGAVTPDELVIAWATLVDGGAVVDWAERAAATDPFGAPQTLDPGLGASSTLGKVGLSGDGLRITFVSPDYSTITEVSRTVRGVPFTSTTTNVDFPGVNPTGSTDGNPGIGPFISGALSPDFKFWNYIQGDIGFVESQKQTGVWSTPSLPANFVPPASSVSTVSPTGWSEDDRTFFYWDTHDGGSENMLLRDPFSLAFVPSSIVPIGSLEQYAYPAAGCTKLYYSATGAGGDLDIFVAPFR